MRHKRGNNANSNNKLNGSDLLELLSLYCHPHTRWPTQVARPVAAAMNQ